jgi:hypothetical protein
MKMPTNETELRLYALGYVDGKVHGYVTIEDETLVELNIAHDYWYQRGYDAGVADFAYDINPQGEEK